jgi:oxygen-independent coproporphyrinogen-3 oxidase
MYQSEIVRIYTNRQHGGGGVSGSYPLLSRGESQHKKVRQFRELLQGTEKTGEPKVIYLHIPFCDSICNFCCFNRVLKQEDMVERYLETVKKEIKMYAQTEYVKSGKFNAMYFGGGTPTCLSTEQLIDLLSYCKNSFDFSEDAEITVEGSTVNSSKNKLKALYENGADRFSFGVQTFHQPTRELLNLQDTADNAIKVIRDAHELGIQNVDIDLMYNLPGQTLENWRRDLQMAINLQLENISLYALSVFPYAKLASQLKNNEIPPVGDVAAEIEMYVEGVKSLTEAGYIQQHLSHFTLPGKTHRYLKMRIGSEDCLAVGAGSNGKSANFIHSNCRSLEAYANKIDRWELPIEACITLSKEDEMRRMMMGGLELLSVNKQKFKERFGDEPENIFSATIKRLRQKNLIFVGDSEITLTETGKIWGHNVSRGFCSQQYMEQLDRLRGIHYPMKKKLFP